MASSAPSGRNVNRIFLFIALAVIGVALGAAILWLIPAILTKHPRAGSPADRLKATNDVRTALIGLLVAVGAAGTLIFTGRSYRLNKEGQITDRYSKAVEQLGDDNEDVKIGGIYLLQRIAQDSLRDRASILEVLSAFVRRNGRGPAEANNDALDAHRIREQRQSPAIPEARRRRPPQPVGPTSRI